MGMYSIPCGNLTVEATAHVEVVFFPSQKMVIFPSSHPRPACSQASELTGDMVKAW